MTQDMIEIMREQAQECDAASRLLRILLREYEDLAKEHSRCAEDRKAFSVTSDGRLSAGGRVGPLAPIVVGDTVTADSWGRLSAVVVEIFPEHGRAVAKLDTGAYWPMAELRRVDP